MGTLFTLLVTLVRIMFILIAVTLISVIVMARNPDGEIPLDPFAQYADILPGQSRDAALQRGFRCQADITLRFDDSCLLTPETGIFSAIQATITSGTGRIRRVVFSSPGQRLTLGQLVLLWGRPEIAIYGPTANFRWRSLHIVAIPQAYDGHFSYLLPIIYVTFESGN